MTGRGTQEGNGAFALPFHAAHAPHGPPSPPSAYGSRREAPSRGASLVHVLAQLASEPLLCMCGRSPFSGRLSTPRRAASTGVLLDSTKSNSYPVGVER